MSTFIRDNLTAPVRKWVYGVLGTAFTIESTLDAFGYGVVPEKAQGAVVAVLSALGFGMAFRRTSDG